jgi:hypothetical protein
MSCKFHSMSCKCNYGQMSYGQMSLSKCLMGKCHRTVNDNLILRKNTWAKTDPIAFSFVHKKVLLISSNWNRLGFRFVFAQVTFSSLEAADVCNILGAKIIMVSTPKEGRRTVVLNDVQSIRARTWFEFR